MLNAINVDIHTLSFLLVKSYTETEVRFHDDTLQCKVLYKYQVLEKFEPRENAYLLVRGESSNP